MSDPYKFTVTEAAKRIKDGQLTPVDLLESLLTRIEGIESRLDAWVTVDAENARKAAKALTREVQRGKLRGPLGAHSPTEAEDVLQSLPLTALAPPELRGNFDGWLMTFPTLDSLGCDVLVVFADPDEAAFEAQRAVLLATLSPEERARCARFHFSDDQRTYLVAHALLRRLLAAQAQTAALAFTFQEGPHGRPEIDEPASARPLRFNLSHTRGLVACAVTRHADIGVDVELVDRKVELEAVGRRVFSPREFSALQALPESAQRDRFFDLWTLKEAYIKAIGQGLSAPLHAITFDAAASDPVPVHFDAEAQDDAASWCLRRHVPSAGHRIAVAFRGHALQSVRFAAIGPSHLLTA